MNVQIKRGDALRLQQVLSDASHLVPDQHEDMILFNKFKYAVGKNYNRLDSLNDQTNARLREILHAEDKEFDAMRMAMKQLAEEYAERDDNGAVIYCDENHTQVRIPNESMPLYEAGKDDLKEKYKDAMARQQERESAADAYLEEMVSVDFHQIDFAVLPRSLGGVWMNSISPMISGIPEELC